MWALVVVLDYLQMGRTKHSPIYIVRHFLQVPPANRYIFFPQTCTFAAVGLLLNPRFLEDPEGTPLPT